MKKIFILLLFTSIISGQNKDPQKILNAVKDCFNKVSDYQADVVVKLDMQLVKVPESKAKVYFKQPDKFKIVSTGFSMLPKQATKFSPSQLLNFDYTPVYVKAETVENRQLDVIKIVPDSDTSDVILSTMWIDRSQSVVYKVETNTRRGGTVITELTYEPKSFPLPSILKFSFNLGEVNIPQNPSNNNSNTNTQRPGHSARLKGSVIMTYSNYLINKGIDDKFFEEKKK